MVFNCDLCNYKTPKKHNLERHITKKHLSVNLNAISVSKCFQCNHCNYTSDKKSNLQRHISSKHLKKLQQKPPAEKQKPASKYGGIVCTKCNCSFKRRTKLIEHLSGDHGVQIEKEEHDFQTDGGKIVHLLHFFFQFFFSIFFINFFSQLKLNFIHFFRYFRI